MSDFRKYKEIENHYRNKYINDTYERHPEYLTCKYHVQEKLDGANVQIKLTVTGNGVKVQYGKRSSFLGTPVGFHGFGGVVDSEEFTDFLGIAKDDIVNEVVGHTVTYFGELFGEGIQNRINYGKGKRILFYDMIVNGEYLTQEELYKKSIKLSIYNLLVPSFGVYDSFDEAMAVKIESVCTSLNPVEGNFMEGVVIKPWNVIAKRSDGQQVLFYVKHKSEAFNEKMKCKRVKAAKVIRPEYQEALDTFSSYVSDNRLKSVFSKEGEIETPKDMGKYIKLLMTDAKADYMKDNNEQFMALQDDERKILFKIAGKLGAKLLQEYL